MNGERRKTRAGLWAAVLCGALAISLVCLIYPIYVIWPFRYQDPRALQVALVVTRFRVPVVEACAAVALLALILYIRSRRKIWRGILAGLGFVLVCGAAALCRVNIYEIMFNPVDRPAFEPVSQSRLDGGEKVIAVRVEGKARAYPIRSISYHHVVNDTLGGVPIVATY